MYVCVLVNRPKEDCMEQMWNMRDRVPEKISIVENFQFTPEPGIKYSASVDNNIRYVIVIIVNSIQLRHQ